MKLVNIFYSLNICKVEWIMYQPQVHLLSLYNKKSNKCDVGLLWINMAKMFIFHKYVESYFIKYKGLLKSGWFYKRNLLDRTWVHDIHTNTSCHLKSDLGVYSWHVCNISWAFNFNRLESIWIKSNTQTLVAI